MERDDVGRIVMSDAEAETVRAALFVAVHHSDDVVGHCDDCFRTVTGVDRSAVPALLHSLDDLNGHNAEVAQWLGTELEKRATWDEEALARDKGLPDLLRSARESGLPIPPSLRDRE